jgi:uncharacterized protein (TIGR01319 family)
MSTYLLIDFGSTYTKVMAVDLEREVFLGRAQSPTTIETDITIGLGKALSNLQQACGVDPEKVDGKIACSSAAGGLKMAAIGLVPALTLEAARRAALGAGAKVVASYGFEIDKEIVREIEEKKCDIVMLCGGTDGGNKQVILHNAKELAASKIECPILVAGNRTAASEVRSILESGGKSVYVTSNVLPTIDTVNVDPAQSYIRDIFIAHIIKAKGLEKAQAYVGKDIIPTPKASLLAANLLASGTEGEAGIGSLLVVEIGGATINIHSVADIMPVNSQTILRGLPESRVKRTVEGDLGIRWNSHTIYELVGQDKLMDALKSCSPGMSCNVDFKEYTDYLYANVEHVPDSVLQYNLDISLAKCATSIAVERHAGTLHKEMTVNGEVYVQYGKNLLEVENVLGTGGIFKYGLEPERILKSALFDDMAPWSLKPKAPKAYLDSEYIMYGIGLLSQQFPDKALRIAKKYLKPVSIQ